MLVYPNPAQDVITIVTSDFEGNYDLVINDVSGKTVVSRNAFSSIGESYQLDISNLHSGVYYISIITQTGNKTLKFIKN